MDEVDVAETLKALSVKMDELSDALIGTKGGISKAFVESKVKAREAIKEKPFICLGGAFIGGLAFGYLMSRKNHCRE